jgi:hypothetical protein
VVPHVTGAKGRDGGGMLAVPITSIAVLIVGRHADPCATLGLGYVGGDIIRPLAMPSRISPAS